jgi:hypothetical protein
MRALLGLAVLWVSSPAAADDTLDDRLSKLEEDLAHTKEQVKGLLPLTGRISGYLDFGFFRVSGNGSGIRPDLGNAVLPEYAGVVPGSWVFMGDPLSTAINSRGEPADTDGSRAVTFDPVHSGGKSSFIVNALNLNLFAGIGSDLVLQALVDFVPRGRDVSNPDGLFLGDFLDVKLAYVEWRVPLESFRLSLFAGKVDSTLGYEYRVEEAPDRISVTPSLICRYTCGRPLGLKARARFLDDALVFNLAVTNGSSFWEGFPFYDEIDSNDVKTVSGRVSYRFPIGSGLEIGASGAIGAQDLQSDDAVLQWHIGGDLHLDWNDLDLAAEYVKGKAEGKTDSAGPACDVAPCLDYQGAYGLLGWRATNWLMPYARVDWRDALHRSGASFVYISQLARVTGGLRLELGTAVIIKAEYTLNRELGRIPQFDDDVFTSSLVVKY